LVGACALFDDRNGAQFGAAMFAKIPIIANLFRPFFQSRLTAAVAESLACAVKLALRRRSGFVCSLGPA
jgi:hypothetical protein